MKLQIFAIGSKLPKWAQTACDEYEKRLPKHLRVDIRTFASPKSSSSRSQAEGELLLKAMADNAFVVALDERGDAWTSKQVASRLERRLQSAQDLALVIGGADGLSPAFLDRANARWSLGAATYPHALVRVIVLEQLYRATTILAGHPYHRE